MSIVSCNQCGAINGHHHKSCPHYRESLAIKIFDISNNVPESEWDKVPTNLSSGDRLKWFTTDKPLPDGWYWHKKDCQSNDEAIIVEVYTGLATKITKWRGQAGSWPVGGDRFDGIPSPDNNYYVRHQWAGPITRPEE